MKNLSDLMKQAQEMQSRMADMQTRLETLEVEGRSGGGLVRVVMTAKGALKRVSIDPSLMLADEREVLEDLLVAAHADARGRAETAQQEEMSKMAGGLGLPLPPGMKLPF